LRDRNIHRLIVGCFFVYVAAAGIVILSNRVALETECSG
jgi:hypothetical protein